MKTLNFIKKPAQNTEQKIFKIFLLFVLPLMALLTITSIVHVNKTKTAIINEMVRIQNGNAAKRISLFFNPIFKDIEYLPTDTRLNPKTPHETGNFINTFSKVYLNNIREIVLTDEISGFSIKLNHDKTVQSSFQMSQSLYQDFLLNDVLRKSDRDRVEWSPAYFDNEHQKSTILAATVFKSPKNNGEHALALVIETTEFLQSLEKYLANRSILFLLPEKEGIKPLKFQITGKKQQFLEESDDPLISTAVDTLSKTNRFEDTPFSFKYNNKRYWIATRKLDIENRQLYSGLIISESKMGSLMNQGWLSYPWYVSTLFVLVLIVTAWLWRRYHIEMIQAQAPPPLNEMDDDSLKHIIETGEGERLEFKSTLRWNLGANRPGKEIEISAFKTLVAFMNSEGGSLIVGIEDNGNILGIEADNFPNEDKFLLHFNNLIKQHLGLVFSKFIQFKTRKLNGHTILVVDCQKADKPVFLKKNGDEEFYIRVGPGSRKLTFTETMNYLKKKR